MTDKEKVVRGLKRCIEKLDTVTNKAHGFNCTACPYFKKCDSSGYLVGLPLMRDALALLKAQEARHRLEIHNIGNVDVPEGVTWEQFQAVMSGVVKALEHTDRGESWPYDEDRR